MRRELMGFLTRIEWKCCWALIFSSHTAEYATAYPLERHASAGAEGPEASFEESFRRAVRYLALDHRFEFEALAVEEDGNILATNERYVEPRNLLYLKQQRFQEASGIIAPLPSPISAIEIALVHLPRKAPQLDVEPLRALLVDLKTYREEAIAGTSSEVVASYARGRRRLAMLATAPSNGEPS